VCVDKLVIARLAVMLKFTALTSGVKSAGQTQSIETPFLLNLIKRVNPSEIGRTVASGLTSSL